MKIKINLNNNPTVLDCQPDESLMSILRRNGCTSVKSGCCNGFCGSCVVLLNDKPIPSCKFPAGLANNGNIVTLEEFSKTSEYKNIMDGFEKAGIKLCGYCNAGKIFTAYVILKLNRMPTREEIAFQIKHLSTCCTDKDTLTNGIIYALQFNKSKNNRKSRS